MHTEVICPNEDGHPGTNRARRRVTSLIRPTSSALRHHAATPRLWPGRPNNFRMKPPPSHDTTPAYTSALRHRRRCNPPTRDTDDDEPDVLKLPPTPDCTSVPRLSVVHPLKPAKATDLRRLVSSALQHLGQCGVKWSPRRRRRSKSGMDSGRSQVGDDLDNLSITLREFLLTDIHKLRCHNLLAPVMTRKQRWTRVGLIDELAGSDFCTFSWVGFGLGQISCSKLKTKSEGLASVLLLHSNRTVSYMRI